MTLAARISALVTRIGNYFRDSILPRLLPSGGSAGQVLGKTGGIDYGVAWKNVNSNFSLEQVLNTAIPITNNFNGRLIQREDGVIMQYKAGDTNSYINLISDLGVDESENSILTAASTFQLNSAFNDYNAISIGLDFINKLTLLNVSNGMIAGSGNVMAITPGSTQTRSGLLSYVIVNTGIPRSMLVINLNNNQYTINNLRDGDILLPKRLANGDLTYHVIEANPIKHNIVTFTTSGVYTKPALCKFVKVIAIGAGGGAGSGRKGAAGTIRSGGGGGASGGYSFEEINASLITGSVTVTVGLAGIGGASVVANSTNGNSGTSGGASSFGTFVTATGGGLGIGGASAITAGGSMGQGTVFGTAGGASSVTGAGNFGGSTGSGTGMAATGGAPGGSITTANVALAGGQGGTRTLGTPILGGTAGAVNTNGGDGVASSTGYSGTGGGGGGASITGNAGNGGKGFGAGGGGGGAATDGVGNSGKGNDGSPGVVIVIEYY
jgi:hypothetical protein